MKNFIKIWTLLIVLTIYSCSSQESYNEIAAGDLAMEETIDEETIRENIETPVERKVIKE
ncbi:MAG: hypothetical protein ABII90_06070 [Bacteroidota bacterium]